MRKVKLAHVLVILGATLPIALSCLQTPEVRVHNTVQPTQDPGITRVYLARVDIGPKPIPTATPTARILPTAVLSSMPTAFARPPSPVLSPPTPAPTLAPSPAASPMTIVRGPRSPSGQERSFPSLADYPRPDPDTGYGFHINGSPYPPGKEVMQNQVIPLLKALGASWVTVWAADPNQVEPVKALVDAGFEVILRYHSIHQPHPDYVPPVEELAKYVAVGVNYFVSGNEPNLWGENSSGNPDDIAKQWWASANNIKEAGGIPLMYPMSPGGSLMNSRVMLQRIMEWLKANNGLGTLENAGVAIHNRPHNKPLDMRDDTSFLEYEWIDDLMVSYLGHSVPLFGTEAGYSFGDLVDANYPRITDQLHQDYNLEIIQGFQTARWRASLFAENFWLLSGFGHYAFPADWWVGNPLYFGKDLPIVDALRNLPKPPRKFPSGGTSP